VSSKARQSNLEKSQLNLLKKELKKHQNKARDPQKARKSNLKKNNLKKHQNHRKCLQEAKNSWKVSRLMILKKRSIKKERPAGLNL